MVRAEQVRAAADKVERATEQHPVRAAVQDPAVRAAVRPAVVPAAARVAVPARVGPAAAVEWILTRARDKRV